MARNENLKIRLSAEEVEEVKGAAAKRIATVSAFMRQAVLGEARKVNAGAAE